MKKILCAEALWDNEISQDRPSYRSLMELIRNETGCKVAYFTFNTPEELSHLLEIFSRKGYDILYIASHMVDGDTLSGYGLKYKTNYADLMEKHAKGLKGKIVHLAGCSSMSDNNLTNVEYLVNKTGVRALSGYAIDTDTTESSAMDLIYLTSILRAEVEDFIPHLTTRYSQLAEISGFKLYTPQEA